MCLCACVWEGLRRGVRVREGRGAGVVGEGSAHPRSACLFAADLIEHLLSPSSSQGQPARRARNAFLQGNFAPVAQETATPVPLTPSSAAAAPLPSALEGVFMRVGPNDALAPTGDFHWFDGAGMVHAVRIKGGRASYASHWVRTARLGAEANAGHPLYTKFGDHRGPLALVHLALGALRARTGVRPPKAAGEGTANTALAFTAGRLLALHEGDLPYALRVACEGVVESLGRAKLVMMSGKDGKPVPSSLTSMTAHPKQDETGFFAISYALDRPGVRYVGLDRDTGAVRFDHPVALPEPVMMHDFAITARYAVLLDVPLVFTPDAMVRSRTAMPFTFKKERPTRFGLLPKHGAAGSGGDPRARLEPRWFTLPGPGVMIFHVANAHETRDGRSVKLAACVFDDFDLDLDGKLAREAKGAAARGEAGNRPDHYARLCEITLDLETGAASRLPLCPLPGDFPRVPDALVGKEARHAYVATMDPASPVPLFSGVAKVDLRKAGKKDAVTAVISHGPHRYGGECAFVPDPARRGEDAGFLVTYVHDESPAAKAASPDGKGKSELVVYDAKSMSPTPVVVLPLPSRVPYGFHVHHMTEAEVRAQAGRPWGVNGVGEEGVGGAREE